MLNALLVFVSLQARPSQIRLYSDTQIVAIRKKFKANRKDGLLTLVPNGKTKPLTVIFKKLGIDPQRLGPPKLTQFDFVMYHDWQVSPKFELSIMVAANGDKDDGYGVRIRRRP